MHVLYAVYLTYWRPNPVQVASTMVRLQASDTSRRLLAVDFLYEPPLCRLDRLEWRDAVSEIQSSILTKHLVRDTPPHVSVRFIVEWAI